MSDLLLTIVKAIFGKLLLDELQTAISSITQWLVRRSADQLVDERERYLEQWLADLEDRKTPLRKLLFAAGIVWAAYALRRDSDGSSKITSKPAEVARLHQIREALLRAHPRHDTVTRVAVRFGVSDFSSFAVKYKAMFGESPSRTLRSKRDSGSV